MDHLTEYHQLLCLQWRMEHTSQNDTPNAEDRENPITTNELSGRGAINGMEAADMVVEAQRPKLRGRGRKSNGSSRDSVPQDSTKENSRSKARRNRLTPSKADQILRSEIKKPLFDKLDRAEAFVYIISKRTPVTAVNDFDGEESTPFTPQGELYQSSEESIIKVLFKVGVTVDLSRRASQIEWGCNIEIGQVWKTGRLERWEAFRLEKYVKKELGCLQKDIHCVRCKVVHKEWFDVSEKTMKETVNRWEIFMKEKPYDEWTGDMAEFWKNRIDGQSTDFEIIGNETDDDRHQRWSKVFNPKWINQLKMIYYKYQIQRHWVAFIYCLLLPIYLITLDGCMIYKLYLVGVIAMLCIMLKPKICSWPVRLR